MNLTTTPQFIGGYNYHIGTNSPFYVNATRSNCTRFVCYLYEWVGNRTITTPIEPIQVIEKEVLNHHSFYFDISNYLKPYIEPQIHDVFNAEDYDSNYKWVTWTIQFYGLNTQNQEVVIETYTAPLHFASAGFRWNEYVRNDGKIDSDGNFYEIFDGGDKFYKITMPYKTKIDDLGIYHTFHFYPDTTNTSALVMYNEFVEDEMDDDKCAYDYQICFMNRFGAFEYFPLKGKVTQTTNVTKEHYQSIVPNYGFLQYINYKPELTQKSINKFSWSSIPLSEPFYLKIEEIIHSPLLFMYNCNTMKMEQVYIPSTNYTRRTFKNDKSKQTYNIDFTSVFSKKK